MFAKVLKFFFWATTNARQGHAHPVLCGPSTRGNRPRSPRCVNLIARASRSRTAVSAPPSAPRGARSIEGHGHPPRLRRRARANLAVRSGVRGPVRQVRRRERLTVQRRAPGREPASPARVHVHAPGTQRLRQVHLAAHVRGIGHAVVGAPTGPGASRVRVPEPRPPGHHAHRGQRRGVLAELQVPQHAAERSGGASPRGAQRGEPGSG